MSMSLFNEGPKGSLDRLSVHPPSPSTPATSIYTPADIPCSNFGLLKAVDSADRYRRIREHRVSRTHLVPPTPAQCSAQQRRCDVIAPPQFANHTSRDTDRRIYSVFVATRQRNLPRRFLPHAGTACTSEIHFRRRPETARPAEF